MWQFLKFWYFWHFLKNIFGEFFEIQNLNFYVKPQSSISLVFLKNLNYLVFLHFLLNKIQSVCQKDGKVSLMNFGYLEDWADSKENLQCHSL